MVNRAAERRPAGLRNYKSRGNNWALHQPFSPFGSKGAAQSDNREPKNRQIRIASWCDVGDGNGPSERRSLQPDGEISLQTRCRCSDSRSLTQLLIATGRAERRLGLAAPTGERAPP